MNTSRSSASGRYLLLLLSAPPRVPPRAGWRRRSGHRRPPAVARLQPALGPGTTPVETVTVETEGGMLTLSSGTRITVPAQAFVDTCRPRRHGAGHPHRP